MSTEEVQRGRFWDGVKARWPYLLVIPIGVFIDLWSKQAVFEWLQPEEYYEVWGQAFRIVRAENPGGVGGIGGDTPWLLVSARIIAIPILLLFAIRVAARERLLHWALALVGAGALGNVYDNLTHVPAGKTFGFGGEEKGEAIGQVRDFLDFDLPNVLGLQSWLDRWPAFNVADSMIVCGALLLAWSALRGTRAEREKRAADATAKG